MIAQHLPWHERQEAFTQAFPQDAISAVVTGPTPENAAMATDKLAQALLKKPNLFQDVTEPDSGEFFARNGLLYRPSADVKTMIDGLVQARPLVAILAADPSLRGAMKVLELGAEGVRSGAVKLDQLAWPLSEARKALEDLLSGKSAFFSWQELVQGRASSSSQTRHVVEIAPKLDFSAI